MKIAEKIRMLASRPEGIGLVEASDLLSKPQANVSTYLSKMTRSGEAIRAGAHGAYRYFTDKDHAAAFDVIGKAEYEKIRAAFKEKRRLRETQRMRDRRGSKPRKPKVIKEPKPMKQTKEKKVLAPRTWTQNIIIETKQQGIDKQRAAREATIIWPDHVKVQKIPGFQGVSYKPDASHQGQFMKEWKELRNAKM